MSPARLTRGKLAVGALLDGFAYGALVLFAFPTVSFWPLAMLLPLPLVRTAWHAADAARAGSRRSVILASLCAGAGTLPAWFYLHAFMYDITSLGYPFHQVYMAAWPALFVWMLSTFIRLRGFAWAGLFAACAWVGVEWIRAEWFLDGYPFFLAAHPMIEFFANHPLGNPASVIGVYGASLVTVIPGVLLVSALFTRLRSDVAPALPIRIGVAAFAVLVNIGVLSPPDDDPARVVKAAMLQTNMPQNNKDRMTAEAMTDRLREYARWLTRSRQCADKSPDLIAWPETSYPGGPLNPDDLGKQFAVGLYWRIAGEVKELGVKDQAGAIDLFRALVEAQRERNVPWIIGGLASDGGEYVRGGPRGTRHNTAFLIRDGKVGDVRYDKMRLTPFGEVIPWVWRWPDVQNWLVNLGANGMAFDLTFGKSPTVFELPLASGGTARIVTPICFEVAYAGQCATLVHQRGDRAADLMVNLSNDGWFSGSMSGRWTHLLVARWRCAETATPMVRSVNTGISAAIDSRGRLLAVGVDGAPPGATPGPEGMLNVSLTLPRVGSRSTIHSRVGDVVGWVSGVLTPGLVAWALFTHARKQRKTAS